MGSRTRTWIAYDLFTQHCLWEGLKRFMQAFVNDLNVYNMSWQLHLELWWQFTTMQYDFGFDLVIIMGSEFRAPFIPQLQCWFASNQACKIIKDYPWTSHCIVKDYSHTYVETKVKPISQHLLTPAYNHHWFKNKLLEVSILKLHIIISLESDNNLINSQGHCS